ncbi:MAG: HD domain-containing protein [Candidatus Aenigmarchaeota archaeon]|nr:HD domain-containing protein [Candidatus Aenigmarchaeota archaeon]
MKEIRKIAKKYMNKNDGAHGWDHVTRVYNLCMRIGKEEGADLEVLELAAFLHDIGISEDRENHEKVSAEITREILKDYDKKKMENVIHCIEVHRFSKGLKPITLEAKILQDADKLDVSGAIGIVRTMFYSGFLNRPVYIPEKEISHEYDGESETAVDHIYEKLMKIREKLNTETAKKIAEQRHDFMKKFMEEFFDEWEGKR